MPYRVINLVTGEPVNETLYTTPDAALMARANYPHIRTRIAFVDVNSNWRDRERSRLEDGTYTALPVWFMDYTRSDHYAHMAADGVRIAFTESEQKGAEDKQLVIPVNTYLARYNPLLSSESISYLTHKFTARDYTLHIEQTEEAFIRAYENVMVKSESSDHTSCMAYNRDHYGTRKHPASVYYTGTGVDSLAIAYLTDPCEDNNVVARAVLWPEHRSYVRIYGTNETTRTVLTDKLNNSGYSRTRDFAGAKLARITHSGSDVFIMPYIDGGAQGVEDRGDHFEIVEGMGCQATETCGYINVGDTTQCDMCGDSVAVGEEVFVDGNPWCEYCADRHARFCERLELRTTDTDGFGTVHVSTRNMFRTEEWCGDAINDDAFYCERTDSYYSGDVFSPIEVVASDSGFTETWCMEATDGYWFMCPECNEYHCKTLASASKDSTGATICVTCEPDTSDDAEDSTASTEVAASESAANAVLSV